MGNVKEELFIRGRDLVKKFCEVNSLSVPSIILHTQEKWRFGACAYYRPESIHICLQKCASPGIAGRCWSWPGYVVDRTPYGVLAHELGHHVDMLEGTDKGAYWSDFSQICLNETGEKAITGYAPNTAEWFAEIFRLWLTNPDLLSKMRPKMGSKLSRYYRVVEDRSWVKVLEGAPERTIEAARKKISKLQLELL